MRRSAPPGPAYRVQAHAIRLQLAPLFDVLQRFSALVSASARVAPEDGAATFGPSASAAQPFLNLCTTSHSRLPHCYNASTLALRSRAMS